MNLTSSTSFWLSLFLIALISLLLRRPFTLLIARPFYPPALRSHPNYLKIHYLISSVWALVYGANALLSYSGIKGPWHWLLIALGMVFSFTFPDLSLWLWLKRGRGSLVPKKWLKESPKRQAVGCAVTPQYLQTLEQAQKELEQSFKDKCDIVVVGAGIGGLTAAALLAQKGYHVQVFEQHSLPGGYCTAFKRKGYTFDAAVLSVTGLEGATGLIWQEAGVKGLDWIKSSLFGRVVAPDKIWEIPQELAEQEDYFLRQFPGESGGIKNMYRTLKEIKTFQSEIPSSPQTVKEAKDFPRRHPAFFKYVDSTWQVFLDDFLSDPQLKALLSLRSKWVGVPPSLAPFTNMVSILLGGSFYPRGGTQKIPDALVEVIQGKGGAVHLRQSVSQLVLDNGRVVGIELANGARVSARAVLYAADFRALAYKMLGRDLLHPLFVKYLEDLTYSPSAFMVYLGVNKSWQGENLSSSQVIRRSYDPENWYQQILQGKMATEEGMSVYIPTKLDPSLAPEGNQVVILVTSAPYNYEQPWKEAKDRMAERMIQQAEKVLPGLSEAIEVQEAASPLTMERYTKNYQGANYGLAQIPTQMGVNRLPHKTPIPGLYLAGHNTFPGAGVQGAAISGWLAAGEVARDV